MNIILGNSLEKLKELEDNSVNSIVTDPPYHLTSIVKRFGKENSAPVKYGKDGSFGRLSKGFMGKEWDGVDENGIGIANNVELWSECLRVLKPGGHLLAFSGTRTYHRMAVAIEDAGFEVRDMIEWVYGSGFPKSLNIGKAVDKLQGKEPIIIGKRTDGRYGSKFQDGNNQFVNAENNQRKEVDSKIGLITKPATPEAKQWEGWGTALKPAHEPICMARKPITEKNIAENVLKWGVGGINIDESRVKAKNGDKFGGGGLNSPTNGFMGNTENTYKKGSGFRDDTHIGRFPANLIHDNSNEVKECFPETKTGAVKNTVDNGANQPINLGGGLTKERLADSGNASRFFKSILYYPKASKKERNMGCEKIENEKFTAGNYSQSPVCKTCDKTLNGTNNHSNCSGEVYYREMDSKKTSNNHPTVKPIALMEYLIKMVTPKGGIVLDPFMGSGSTGVAAKKNGYDFIGIDMTPEYVEIAKARINATEIENRLI